MGSGGSKKGKYIIIDIEGPATTEADGDLVTDLNKVVSQFGEILSSFSDYKGSGKLIREAISNPNKETENRAWEEVRVGVVLLKNFFEVGTTIERELPRMYGVLCSGDASTSLTVHNGLTKLLCSMLDFATKFDDLKMTNPAVQNDLAYYRRVLSRLKRERKLPDGEIKDEVVDRMSLFYAHASPMCRVVIDTTTQFLNSEVSGAGHIDAVLSRLAESCRGMVADEKITNTNTQQLALRVMTACLLILDHIHEGGVFSKKSPVDVVGCIKLLETNSGQSMEGLMNSLRFMTIHVREPNALPYVKKALW